MAYELDYVTYNFGQYPEQKGEMADRIAAGWRVLNSSLNYNEVYILWHRGDDMPQQVLTPLVGHVHCDGCQCEDKPEEAPEEPAETPVPQE